MYLRLNSKFPIWYNYKLVSVLKFKIFKNQLDKITFESLRNDSENLMKECYDRYIASIKDTDELSQKFLDSSKRILSSHQTQRSSLVIKLLPMVVACAIFSLRISSHRSTTRMNIHKITHVSRRLSQIVFATLI